MKNNKLKLGLILFVFIVLFVVGLIFTILPFGKFRVKSGVVKTAPAQTVGFKIDPQITPEDALLQITELVRSGNNTDLDNVLTPEISTEKERKYLLDLLKNPQLKKMELGNSFYNNGMNEVRVTFTFSDNKVLKKIFSLIIEKQSWKLDGIKDIRVLASNKYAGTQTTIAELKVTIPNAWTATENTQGRIFSNSQLTSTDPTKLRQGEVMLQIANVGNTDGQKLADSINCQKFVGSKCSIVEINSKEYTIIEAIIPNTTLNIGMIPIEQNGKAYLVSYFYQKDLPAATKTTLEAIVATITF